MTEGSVLKSLSRETKALILVSEYEAKRMPMFQLRAVFNELALNEEEKKVIIDLVENDLRATGYHPDQITAFLSDLLMAPQAAIPGSPPPSAALQTTRRLRSPFTLGFEQNNDSAAPSALPMGVVSSVNVFAPQPTSPLPPSVTPPALLQTPATPKRMTFVNIPPKDTMAPASKPASAALPAIPGASPQKPPSAGFPAVPTQMPGNVKPVPPSGPLRRGVEPVGTRMLDKNLFFGGKPMGVRVEEKRPLIVLADDDKRIRMVFKLKLEEAGFRVIEAEDGNEAWKHLQDGADLAVLDMKMPGLHGLEVISRMVDARLSIPVIVCSAHDQLKDEFIVATYPKLRYLVKPIAPDELIKSARELLSTPK
jgi:CheY-like chemotaxis protein